METSFNTALADLKTALTPPSSQNLYARLLNCLDSYTTENQDVLTKQVVELCDLLWSDNGNAVPYWAALVLTPARDGYLEKTAITKLLDNACVVRSYLLLAHAFDTSEEFIKNSQGDKYGQIFEVISNFDIETAVKYGWLEATGLCLLGPSWPVINMMYEITQESTIGIKDILKNIPENVLVRTKFNTETNIELPTQVSL